jgi:hypothetical protein
MNLIPRKIELPENLEILRQFINRPEEADEIRAQYFQLEQGIDFWPSDVTQACHVITQPDESQRLIWTYYARHRLIGNVWAIRITTAMEVSETQALAMVNARMIAGQPRTPPGTEPIQI